MNILLVEDDPGVGRFINRGLIDEGYNVEWLRTGKSVVKSLEDGTFAAVILDLGLPDMDGAEVCRTIRENGNSVPVCMLTARTALEEKLAGFRSGADDYLTKPFAFKELLARLAVMVRRGERMSGETLTVGALVIDLKVRVASVHGAPVALSRRELDVLISLARNAGHVVTRQQLRQKAWPEGVDVTDNAVDVYVGYVRRRLAEHDGAPPIETVRGAGFRLVRPDRHK